MKISTLVGWLCAVILQSKAPSKGPPYHSRSFGILGSEPSSKKMAQARLSKLERLMTDIETAIVQEMQEHAPDEGRSHARTKHLQKALVAHLKESICIKQWLDSHCVPYRFQSKEDALVLFSRELIRDRISYVRLHTEKYPPNSIAAAEKRIRFLNEQEKYVFAGIFDDIEAKGKRLGCGDRQIRHAKHHVTKIQEVVLHERRILKDWVARERIAIRISNGAGPIGTEASFGDGSSPSPA